MRKLFILITALISIHTIAQKKPQAGTSNNVDSVLFSKVKYRLVGPFRGGRSGAATGDYKNKNTFYFGATGGGIWKTMDGGNNWKNISDKYFGGTIGAVAVAPSDENIIYVGEGENTMRGNVSEGLGGIRDGRHIIRIIIHPRDPNTVWLAR
jgi:hypothetical protein